MSTRIRVSYSKQGAMRFTGHLDLQQVWERTLRRSQLPIAYSLGFHPQVRLHLACALPLGVASRGELLDFWLLEPVEIEQVTQSIRNTTPPGISVLNVAEIDLHAPNLQVIVSACEYEITLLTPVEDQTLSQNIAELLSQTSVMRHRHDKDYDLRPLIEKLEMLPVDDVGCQRLAMQLAAREGATGRPEEVLAALAINFADTRVERMRIILKEGAVP